jgi:hypothetical protein
MMQQHLLCVVFGMQLMPVHLCSPAKQQSSLIQGYTLLLDEEPGLRFLSKQQLVTLYDVHCFLAGGLLSNDVTAVLCAVFGMQITYTSSTFTYSGRKQSSL